jgi:2-polyprenyl-3-methyl-5-hydroxy-6-metoxy-1,4-benzoquinol methylase
MDTRTRDYYRTHAVETARRYESADPSLIHDNLPRAFTPGSRLLEIGVGSGRDAAFLSSRGYTVTDADASVEMIA